MCVFQLEQALQLEKGEAAREDPNAQGLFQQNIELRRRLEEEHSGYKRKLQAYQEGQQRQAQLVQKLQAKVRTRAVYSCASCRLTRRVSSVRRSSCRNSRPRYVLACTRA